MMKVRLSIFSSLSGLGVGAVERPSGKGGASLVGSGGGTSLDEGGPMVDLEEDGGDAVDELTTVVDEGDLVRTVAETLVEEFEALNVPLLSVLGVVVGDVGEGDTPMGVVEGDFFTAGGAGRGFGGMAEFEVFFSRTFFLSLTPSCCSNC